MYYVKWNMEYGGNDQRAMCVTSDSKGISYDIYVETEKETFDAQMQNNGNESVIKELPKRSRIYPRKMVY